MNLSKDIDRILEMHKSYPKHDVTFVSIGNKDQKATVKVFKTQNNIKRNILKLAADFRKKTGKTAQWVKLDFIIEILEVDFNAIKDDLINTRRNYIDYGISLDNNWNYAFLAEEINANAFVRPSKDKKSFILSEDNINNYLKKYKGIKEKYSHTQYEGKRVLKFYTKGYFIEGTSVYNLDERGYTKGLRKVSNLNNEIDTLIKNSAHFLKGEIKEEGKYHYGYFPHFDKNIAFYNNLRHSSSTYALIEGLAYIEEDISVAEKAIDYLINHYLYEIDGVGHIYDDTKNVNEIKLGQNAAFIFAVCEYLKFNPNKKEYIDIAQKVARGIASMINENAKTIHVLNYPDLSVKENYRIIYYDGEAALALLRLYQIDNDETWLNLVKNLFERFIKKEYWKYHDHWLGYCTNELVQIDPQEKYYKFGIQNVSSYLDFIHNRETTFPTFLEMLMSTYHLVEKAKSTGFESLVKQHLNEDQFIKTIHARANYQRTGYFYPEVAMYFKNPSNILNSFFIKHHGYRVRIDDIEHYLSGYVQYQKVFNKN
ncbi:poly(glycerol-phosphate) alpha-glucosyltransferase [Mammaliicoccus fleurettii]|uniref:poly(glycerol-phosphate) alpha-glucosyltransferase n=1 Tax=Mammaliicoccus fleurettii TaxID=150056 RepID=UPI000993633D|nr:poly(glycerol-phosphate) alpha-glucosyltransferase [Mammaliicoccus fleurettii]OOV76454.1 poly(glycerol-phosphate) alpha-glucosyltransferase [Mammaliicoccus fleurettii]